MDSYVKIKLAIPLAEYKLQVTFEDNRQKIFDLSSLVHSPLCKDWKDPMFFNHVALYEHRGAVFWPNGFDIDAETLLSKYS